MSVLFAVSLGLVAASAPAAAVRRGGPLAALAGSLLFVVVGSACAGGWSHAFLDLGDWLGYGQAALRVDRLAGKLYRTVFLGHARRVAELREPVDVGAGVVALALVALALGPAAPWEVRLFGRGLSGVLGFGHFSVLAPTWLAVSLVACAAAAAAIVWAALRPGVRRAPVWLSGSAASAATVQYTPEGCSNPIRVVLRGAYELSLRLRPEAARAGATPTFALETRIVRAFEQYVYEPLTAGGLALSALVARLRSGRLGTYLLYMLVVLIVVLALIPALR